LLICLLPKSSRRFKSIVALHLGQEGSAGDNILGTDGNLRLQKVRKTGTWYFQFLMELPHLFINVPNCFLFVTGAVVVVLPAALLVQLWQTVDPRL
jgi:hypothetical protein